MEKKKKCIICGEIKPLSAYYNHPKMADGHLNKCKECTKMQSKQRLEILSKNTEWVEKERIRSREKYYRLRYKDKYKPSYESKRRTMSIFYKKYPEKKIANSMSSHIKTPKGYNKHHWSYNENHNKDVIFLSVKNHNKFHRYSIYDQERMMYRSSINIGEFLQNELIDTKQKAIKFIELIKELP